MLYTGVINLKGEIKTGYLAMKDKYPEDEKQYIITDSSSSVLAPSQDLLVKWEEKELKWDEYLGRYVREIFDDEDACEKLNDILDEVEDGETVRLICFEQNPPCHRYILVSILMTLKQLRNMVNSAF